MTASRRPLWFAVAVLLAAAMACAHLVLGFSSAHASSALFSDDFESDAVGSSAAGWNVASGSWAVAMDGSHVLKESDPNTATVKSINAGSNQWTDYSAVAQIKPGSSAAGTSNVLAARYTDDNNSYALILKDGNSWYFGKKVNGAWTTFANGAMTYNTSSWYSFEIDAVGNKLSAYLNGTKLASTSDSTFAAGAIAVLSRSTIEVDNVVATAIAPPPPASPSPSPSPSPAPSPSPSPSPSPLPSPSPSPSPSPPPSSAPSTIQGTVSVSGAGTPVAGAVVSTRPASSSATTDSAGGYVLNLTAGTYDVIFSASGFNSDFAPAVDAPPNGVAVTNDGLIPVPPFAAEDLFSRPDQAGIGTASDGHSWANDLNVYPQAQVSIVGRSAYVQTATANTDHDTWMGTAYRDEEITADLYVVSAVSDPRYLHGGRLLGRVQGSDIWIDMALNTDNNTLTIWVDSSGSWTQLGSASATFALNTWYHAKLDMVGANVYGKAWPVGSPEPGWLVKGTQTALMSPGVGGLRCGAADVYFANYLEAPITQISGTVTDAATGAAIAGATVSLTNGSTSTTDSGGSYVFRGLTAGTYTVSASAPGHSPGSTTATVNTGLSATSVNLALS